MKNNRQKSPMYRLMPQMAGHPSKYLVHGAAVAAIYVTLTLMFQPISYGPIQFRISEALCILPYLTTAAVPGIFIG